jgi:hypothetical protein
MLVRADLFAALGGFDPGIDFLGEDINLCWRAHVAGARVLVAPGAQVRHLEALGRRRGVDDRRRLQARHRLRTVLSCYSPFHLVRVLPQAAVLTLLEVVYALVVGRGRQARDIAGAWPWNLRHLNSIRRQRRALARVRQVSDAEVRELQVRGFARVSAVVRGQIGRTGDDRLTTVATAGRDLADFFRSGPSRAAVIAWVAVLALFLIGGRHLITRPFPAVGGFAAFPDDPIDLVRNWVSGWSSAGLGSQAPNPTAFGLLGGLGFVFLGAMGVLQKVLVLGLLPLGALGAWRLMAPTGSRGARVVALIVYVAVPVPYNALAEGRWAGLALYAAAPWILARLARVTAVEPFSVFDPDTRIGVALRARRQHLLALGVILAVTAMLVPAVALIVVVVALGLVVGSFVAGQSRGTLRLVVAAVVSAAVGAVLQLPWVLDFLPPRFEWSQLGLVPSVEGGGLALDQILRFESGPIGSAPLGYAFLAVAAVPLLLGRDWRLGWAIRGWGVALACWGLLWVAEQGWLPYEPLAPEVLLAPAAAGLALAAGLGLAAFQRDMPGSFGWRQFVSVAGAAALCVGVVPVLGAAFDGRWDVPRGDFGSSLSFLDEEEEAAPFRVLWLGQADVLPLAGWELEDQVQYASSDGGQPRVQDLWAGSSHGATSLMRDALDAAIDRETNRLGRLLAPMGVQYVVVVQQLAPKPFSDVVQPAPQSVTDALGEQLDLEAVEVNPALVVYRNIAWMPERAFLPDADTGSGEASPLAQAVAVDLSGAEVALPDEVGYAEYEGPVEAGNEVYLSAADSSRWELVSGGRTASRREAFGWANAFSVENGGDATLRFRTPALRYGLLIGQVALWVIVLFALFRGQLARPSRVPLDDQPDEDELEPVP